MKTKLSRSIYTKLLAGVSFLIASMSTALAQTDVRLTYINQYDVTSTGSITLLPGFWVQEGVNFRAHIIDSTTAILPSLNRNYVLTYIAKKPNLWTTANPNPGVKDVVAGIQYFDQAGRLDQEIAIKGSASFRDIVTPHRYDLTGKEAVSYLPYVAYPGYAAKPFGNGTYHADAFSAQLRYHYSPPRGIPGETYTSTNFPFAIAKFENSPFARLQEQGAVGQSWQPASTVPVGYGDVGHTQKFEERSLSSSDQVAKLSVSINTTTGARTLVYAGTYDGMIGNWLKVTIAKDEEWTSAKGNAGLSLEFKNADDQVILKRRTAKIGSSVENFDTYYVYDDFGNLSFVLPPKFEVSAGNLANQTLLDELVYQYKYDGRQRIVEKKLPGKGWEYLVYNKQDAVVATQDAQLRTQGKWMFHKYDVLGRKILSGITVDASTRPAYQTNVDNQMGELWEKETASTTGYTNAVYPTANLSYLTMNYYDHYDFPGGNPYPDALSTGNSIGSLTGSKVNVLGTTDFLWTVVYYDEEKRIAKNFVQHYKGGVLNAGNYDVSTNSYDFSGALLASDRRHFVAATETLKVLMEQDYDAQGKLINTWQTINNKKTLLSRLEYDEFGKLSSKMLHSTDGTLFLDTITYSRNVRDWQTSVSSRKGMLYYRLDYLANSNISSFTYSADWSDGKFYYVYDDLNRLTRADNYIYSYTYPYEQYDANMGEEITYDKNGNILTLNRGGSLNGPMSYQYHNGMNSNRLDVVIKNGSTFRTYQQNANGNATTDGFGNTITYNILDLAQEVKTPSNTVKVSYTYTASGERLRKQGYEGTIDYIAGLMYKNGVLLQLATPEGKAEVKGPNDYHYVYDLKDHLGNTRVSFDEHPTTHQPRPVQTDEYYAFGLHVNKQDNSNSNKYLYNGKEKQDELNGQYDYGARFYDPVIARWNSVDPMAEQGRRWSPYNYVFNNPIYFIDPDGMWARDPILDAIRKASEAATKFFTFTAKAEGKMDGFGGKARVGPAKLKLGVDVLSGSAKLQNKNLKLEGSILSGISEVGWGDAKAKANFDFGKGQVDIPLDNVSQAKPKVKLFDGGATASKGSVSLDNSLVLGATFKVAIFDLGVDIDFYQGALMVGYAITAGEEYVKDKAQRIMHPQNYIPTKN